MPFFADRVKVATATVGAGTVTLGAALTRFRTFAAAAVPNSSLIRYLILDGAAWEVGVGTYDSAAGTLTRSITGPGCASSTGALLVLSGAASVEITFASIDFRNTCMVKKSADQSAADYTTGAGVIMTWDAEVFDDGGWHDNVTNNSRLTVPAGVDRVRVGLQVGLGNMGDNTAQQVAVLKNGSSSYDGMTWGNTVRLLEQASSTPRFSCSSGPIPCVPGDYFEARLLVLGDNSVLIEAARSNFWIEAY